DGSDLAASLRNPGNYCNVVGFRPTPGRVPSWPAANAWDTLSVMGPIGRTVEDTAFLLSAMAGLDPRAPTSLGEPGSVFSRPLRRAAQGAARPVERHRDLEHRGRLEAQSRADRARRDIAQRALSPHARLPREIRLPPLPGEPVTALPARGGMAARYRRRAAWQLSRLDEELLLHHHHQPPRDIGARRLHARRAARRLADRGSLPRRLRRAATRARLRSCDPGLETAAAGG